MGACGAVLLSLATLGSTLGGLFALRFRDRLHYLLSFTAGVLLGVVGFEALPDIFELAQQRGLDVAGAMVALVVGFLLFHSIEKFVLIHHAHEADYAAHHHAQVGVLSALALVGHSLLDGVGIGLAFQVSQAIGVSPAIAVIAHDFCDGLNTVGLMLTRRNNTRRSAAMLGLDAVAPVLGAASTLLFQMPRSALMLYLGFFAGLLLYISVSDILPEAHSGVRPATAIRLFGLTRLGAAFVFAVARSCQIRPTTPRRRPTLSAVSLRRQQHMRVESIVVSPLKAMHLTRNSGLSTGNHPPQLWSRSIADRSTVGETLLIRARASAFAIGFPSRWS